MIRRVLCGLPAWLAYAVLMIPLIAVGFVLCAIAPAAEPAQDADGIARAHWRWRWMWLWDNAEDAIDGVPLVDPPKNPAWIADTHGWSAWRRRWWWSARRNSVGNARRTRLFGMTVIPLEVQLLGRGIGDLKEGPYVAWQGWRYEVKWCWNRKNPDWQRRRYFWLGWRLAQQTAVTPDVGLAFQPWMRL